MNADLYSETFTVHDFETDVNRNMTPGAILRRAQQISTDHCISLGIDTPLYERTHTAFLLAKFSLLLYQPIPAETSVLLTTKPSAPQHAIYHRYTSLCDQNGQLLCEVDSSWVLINTQTRRILRSAPQELPLPFMAAPAKLLDASIQKADASFIGDETAVYSRCDQNHHLNNTSYADILCDHLPHSLLLERQIQRVAIAYHKEIPLGNSFQLYRAELSDRDYYFMGQSEAGKHFEAQFTFK